MKDLSPIPKSHPFTAPPEIVQPTLALGLEQPSRGCNWICNRYGREGISASHPTVQKILNRHGMGTQYERLEEKAQEDAFFHVKCYRRVVRFFQMKMLPKGEPWSPK